MSKIQTNKLQHTANGAAEFTLPTSDGTNGQVLKTNGSGTLSFGADSGGLYASYALLADIKANSVDGGGSMTSGDWRTRDLNTELHDADGIVSISSNQFGPVAYTLNSENVTNESFLRTRFTISGAKVFEIRQRFQSNITTFGGGVGLSSYWTGSSIFTVVEIFKEN